MPIRIVVVVLWFDQREPLHVGSPQRKGLAEPCQLEQRVGCVGDLGLVPPVLQDGQWWLLFVGGIVVINSFTFFSIVCAVPPQLRCHPHCDRVCPYRRFYGRRCDDVEKDVLCCCWAGFGDVNTTGDPCSVFFLKIVCFLYSSRSYVLIKAAFVKCGYEYMSSVLSSTQH